MKMKITTYSPMHIGSGERYGVMESYVEGDEIKRVNLDTIFNDNPALSKEYVGAIDGADLTKLQSILRKGKVRYVARLRTGVMISRMKDEIRECIKDANGDIPYIPGSTLKGFIRTALITKYLLSNNGMFLLGDREYNMMDVIKNGIYELNIRKLGDDRADRNPKFLGKRFEEILVYAGQIGKKHNGRGRYRFDAKYDIFKLLEVGDFYPTNHSLWVDRATVHTNGRMGAHVFVETVEGEFSGEIRLSPLIRTLEAKTEEYPLLSDKIRILGISLDDLGDLESAESKMVKHIISSVGEFVDLAKRFGKSDSYGAEASGANVRLGFGTGILYKTLWVYVVKNDRYLAEKILRSMNKYRAHVDSFPKSHYKLSDGRTLGWARLEVMP